MATACIGLSPGIVDGIKKKVNHKKVKMIPNGCDIRLIKNISYNKNMGKFTAVYTGAHGFANGLDAVLDAAKILLQKGENEIEVQFIGDGALKTRLNQRAKDEKINNIKVRFQKISDLPPKELRRLVDKGKKEIGEGLIIIFTSKDEKVGLAVGVTTKLTSKYDAVKFAKLGSEIIGGKGGGGRPDFAQAGGFSENKIDEAFEKLKVLI